MLICSPERLVNCLFIGGQIPTNTLLCTLQSQHSAPELSVRSRQHSAHMTTTNVNGESMRCTINFRVRCTSEYARDWDDVMVVGDVPELSNWMPDNAVPMHRSIEDRLSFDCLFSVAQERLLYREVWEASVEMPRYKQVQYRYFVCQYLDDAREEFSTGSRCIESVVIKEQSQRIFFRRMVISRWETQRLPRTLIPSLQLREGANTTTLNEEFGVYGVFNVFFN